MLLDHRRRTVRHDQCANRTERGGPELRVILANLRGDARVMRMQELLPEGFRLESQTPAQATVRKRAERNRKSHS